MIYLYKEFHMLNPIVKLYIALPSLYSLLRPTNLSYQNFHNLRINNSIQNLKTISAYLVSTVLLPPQKFVILF
jgi:hypothetical protein